MDVREFPVLTEIDRPLVDRFATGLGEDASRVLAYLQLRYDDAELERTATGTEIHIGAGVGRHAARDALEELSTARLVAETSIRTATPGRPPKAWHATAGRDETVARVYARHARRLCRQGERFTAVADAGFEELPDAPPGSDGANDDAFDRSGEGFDPADDSEGPSGELRSISVGLNWEPNGLHVPLFAADGSDESSGASTASDSPGTGASGPDLSLSFDAHDGSRDAIDAVAAGGHDVCVAGAATLLRERAAGRDVVPVAVPFQRSMVVLYTTRAAFGGSFDAVDQLAGRRIGMPSGAETRLLGRLLLEQAGIREDVQLVDVAGEERAALRSGRVDVVTGMISDPVRLEAATHDPVDVVTVSEGFPVYGPTLAAAGRTVEDRPELVEAVLAAVMVGWVEASCEPTASATAVADAAGSDESVDRIVRTFERARSRFASSDAVRRHGWGWHSPASWRDLHTALTQGGVIAADGGP